MTNHPSQEPIEGYWFTASDILRTGDGRTELADNRQLRAALTAIRVKALPAGAAVGLQRNGWEDRCREVLDIIDAALAGLGYRELSP